MKFRPPLQQAILLQRYKRFLADVRFPDGSECTVHCPNTGAMRGCSQPGSPAALSVSDNPRRKYRHTLEMVQNGGVWVGVNTARSNATVMEAITRKKIPCWQDVTGMKAEVKTGEGTRLDLRLDHADGSQTYVEIKSCSLAEGGCAIFPDAVTARGTKHLLELQRLKETGEKTALVILVQRLDADRFRPAAEIDPLYAETFHKVRNAGVEVIILQLEVSPEGVEVVRELPLTKE